MYEWFLKFHFLLAGAILSVLIWHVWSGSFTRIKYPLAALFLWSFDGGVRLYRILSLNTFTREHTVFTEVFLNDTKTKASMIIVRFPLKRPMTIDPGKYMYLKFRGTRLFDQIQAHPFMISWWDEVSGANPLEAKSLTFFIQPQAGLTARLVKTSKLDIGEETTPQERATRSAIMDGPYGRNLHLENYQTVILVAKGAGISGVLAYARQLLIWKSYRKQQVLTRKLKLHWELDDNSQDTWLGPFLMELKSADVKVRAFLNAT